MFFFFFKEKVKWVTFVKGDPKAPFSIATMLRSTPFSGLLHFTLDPHLIVLSAKQGGIKYHFLNIWYDLTWDWTRPPGPLVNTLLIWPKIPLIYWMTLVYTSLPKYLWFVYFTLWVAAFPKLSNLVIWERERERHTHTYTHNSRWAKKKLSEKVEEREDLNCQ